MGRVSAVLWVLLVVLAGTGLAQEGVKIPGWGEVLDPGGDCKVGLDGKALVIGMPEAEQKFDVAPGQRNAPSVTRYVEGNFTVQVKVTGALDQGAPGSRTAGLMLWLDERNFVRLCRVGAAGDGASSGLLFAYWKDAQEQPAPEAVAQTVLEGPSAWLRLTRRMSKLTAEVSGDGQTWREVGTIPIRLSSRLRLGVMATNTSGKPLEVRFEELVQKAIPLYPTGQ